MDNLSNKQMIEHLSRFRDAGDKLSDDIFNLSLKILDIINEAEGRANRTDEDSVILAQLKNMSEMLISSTLDANAYNNSMWKDYTKVIKALGNSTEVKRDV
ncbi:MULTISPECIES: hypothetical protein [Serratia]|uniref:hypothetical protein n=1 Tax=Serratia TaxID=613 RepID=UPI0015738750|nr:hypothetical protein [Serratia marcescens]MBI6134843.1 hypothetical protein [Serratia marcescens]MDN0028031.1 hypothetical protein [Serratia marcescens]NSM47776.1 hypothetical protein [Serratia marcescens]